MFRHAMLLFYCIISAVSYQYAKRPDLVWSAQRSVKLGVPRFHVAITEPFAQAPRPESRTNTVRWEEWQGLWANAVPAVD